MAEAQLQVFLDKVRQLNAFVALSEADPQLRRDLRDCDHHDQVVALARRCGFEIGRRWGEPPSSATAGMTATATAEPPTLPGSSQPLQAGDGLVPRADSGARPTGGEGTRGGMDGVIVSLLPPELLRDCPAAGEERTQVLLETPSLRLERIHSCEAVSPPGFWYQQDEAEWVVLLHGSASVQFADACEERHLKRGDSLLLSPGRRHRVTATDPCPGTVWLALFWRDS